MKIFRFGNPLDTSFARAGRLGTWYPDPGPGTCPECGASRQRRIPPMIMEWLPDSDVIADFTWPGGDMVVTQQVWASLKERFQGLEFGPVEMWQDPKLKRPKRVTKRTKPRVWLPYEGPPLRELWVTSWAHADMERSSIRLIKTCATCGTRFHDLTGVEERKHRWDPIEKELIEIHIPREEGKGVYVKQADLRNADIFGLHELPGSVFCVERVKAFIEQEQFTNVSFLEMGKVLK